jgi:glycosyltransferase involved in cell wall biosynthesis
VDDGSTDNSVSVINEVIDQAATAPNVTIRLLRHPINKGVCAAKNLGGLSAEGKWIVFLDSDDELIASAATYVKAALEQNPKSPLHFFACLAESESTTGIREQVNLPKLRDFNSFLVEGTDGEALPVVSSEAFKKFHYDEDINGYESLCYLRIARHYAAVVVNSIFARRYYTSHQDRLSSKAGIKRRYQSLAEGHLRVIREHWRHMPFILIAKQCLRLVKSKMLAY